MRSTTRRSIDFRLRSLTKGEGVARCAGTELQAPRSNRICGSSSVSCMFCREGAERIGCRPRGETGTCRLAAEDTGTTMPSALLSARGWSACRGASHLALPVRQHPRSSTRRELGDANPCVDMVIPWGSTTSANLPWRMSSPTEHGTRKVLVRLVHRRISGRSNNRL